MSRKRTWTINQLQEAVKTSRSRRQVLKKLGLIEAGGNYNQIRKYLEEHGIDTAHFTGPGWRKGVTGIWKPIRKLADILVENSIFQSHQLRKRLIKENLKAAACEECGWAKFSEDGRLPLELDHINGNNRDNRFENLRILCPNCHSLKPTHRGSNCKNKNARVL